MNHSHFLHETTNPGAAVFKIENSQQVELKQVEQVN